MLQPPSDVRDLGTGSCASTCLPYGECTTSGWNWMKWNGRLAWRAAANAQFVVCATAPSPRAAPAPRRRGSSRRGSVSAHRANSGDVPVWMNVAVPYSARAALATAAAHELRAWPGTRSRSRAAACRARRSRDRAAGPRRGSRWPASPTGSAPTDRVRRIAASGVVAAHDLGVHAQLAHAARDQLRVLRAEVEDHDELAHRSRRRGPRRRGGRAGVAVRVALNAGTSARSVNTIATPRRSQAAITSSSRTEPPGWTTARMPAAAACSTLSANGKNPSLASERRRASRGRRVAPSSAPRRPRRRGWSGPSPGRSADARARSRSRSSARPPRPPTRSAVPSSLRVGGLARA